MSRVSRLATGRPRTVLALWAALVALLGVAGIGVADKLRPTELIVPGTEVARWDALKDGHFGENATVLLTGPAAELERQGPRLARELARDDGLVVISPWSGSGGEELRPEPDVALLVLDLQAEGRELDIALERLGTYVEDHTAPPVEPSISGLAPLGVAINEEVEESIRKAELLALPILALVLLLVFRAPVAAAVPLVIAIGTVASGFGLISLIADLVALDAIALSLASMIGLALGVDYSLLIVMRFREGLADGRPVRKSADLAANTAGRTAVFAGATLIAIMLVTLALSPGSVLLSAAIGSIVVAALSMLAAALVVPAALQLLGHRVNSWQVGARTPRESRLGALVRRFGARPGVAAAATLLLLLALAAPATGIDTLPPDPKQLPDDSPSLDAYLNLRDAGIGPGIEVVVSVGEGTVVDQRPLRRITKYERTLSRLPGVRLVVGPGSIADAADGLGEAPSTEEALATVRRGERGLERVDEELDRADSSVDRLFTGLGTAAAGARQLAAGTGTAGAGAGSLAGGTVRASAGAVLLAGGISQAVAATDEFEAALARAEAASARLVRGAGLAARGAGRLRDGAGALADALEGRLARGARKLARGLARGGRGLARLREPAQVVEGELAKAFGALRTMTAGRLDPFYERTIRAVGTALAAARGRDPRTGEAVEPGYEGLDRSLARAVVLTDRARDGAGALARGTRQAGDAARRLARGTARLEHGLGRLRAGLERFEAGITRMHDGIEGAGGDLARLDAGAARLAAGLERLGGGAGALRDGLAEIAVGQRTLASGLESGVTRAEPLRRELGATSRELDRFIEELGAGRDPAAQLAAIRRLLERSPGFLRSGFLTVAALSGTRSVDRDASQFVIDSLHGGDVGRIAVMPDVPTNSPRTSVLVDRVIDATGELSASGDLEAAVGGSATELAIYDRVTTRRIPWLIAAIALVTYLMLVPILRSLVLAAIAVALNLLTVAAGFGILTLLFVGDDPILGGAGGLDVITVAGIFAITFALSIDYQVFLLTRMREEFVRKQDNEDAIRYGVERTAGVVTGAAVIMIGVFAAFALSSFVIIRQFGVGLATAVLIDATVVRLVLLPAVMRMAGLTPGGCRAGSTSGCRSSTSRARATFASRRRCASPSAAD